MINPFESLFNRLTSARSPLSLFTYRPNLSTVITLNPATRITFFHKEGIGVLSRTVTSIDIDDLTSVQKYLGVSLFLNAGQLNFKVDLNSNRNLLVEYSVTYSTRFWRSREVDSVLPIIFSDLFQLSRIETVKAMQKLEPPSREGFENEGRDLANEFNIADFKRQIENMDNNETDN